MEVASETLDWMAEMLKEGMKGPHAAAFACGAVYATILGIIKKGETNNETV